MTTTASPTSSFWSSRPQDLWSPRTFPSWAWTCWRKSWATSRRSWATSCRTMPSPSTKVHPKMITVFNESNVRRNNTQSSSYPHKSSVRILLWINYVILLLIASAHRILLEFCKKKWDFNLETFILFSRYFALPAVKLSEACDVAILAKLRTSYKPAACKVPHYLRPLFI